MCELILSDFWSFLCNFLDENEKKYNRISFAINVEQISFLEPDSIFQISFNIPLLNCIIHFHLKYLYCVLVLIKKVANSNPTLAAT